MASIANLPDFERHVSALKTITEVINDIQEELDDSSDIKGQTLLQLRQIRLSICEKLKVLSGNPGTRAFLIYFSNMLIIRSEPTIAAPSAGSSNIEALRVADSKRIDCASNRIKQDTNVAR